MTATAEPGRVEVTAHVLAIGSLGSGLTALLAPLVGWAMLAVGLARAVDHELGSASMFVAWMGQGLVAVVAALAGVGTALVGRHRAAGDRVARRACHLALGIVAFAVVTWVVQWVLVAAGIVAILPALAWN